MLKPLNQTFFQTSQKTHKPSFHGYLLTRTAQGLSEKTHICPKGDLFMIKRFNEAISKAPQNVKVYVESFDTWRKTFRIEVDTDFVRLGFSKLQSFYMQPNKEHKVFISDKNLDKAKSVILELDEKEMTKLRNGALFPDVKKACKTFENFVFSHLTPKEQDYYMKYFGSAEERKLWFQKRATNCKNPPPIYL